jgi:hypothetical protein
MSKDLKIHYGKTWKILPIPTCYNCDKFVDELYECNHCGHKFCADCITQNGNGIDDIRFICNECYGRRRGEL